MTAALMAERTAHAQAIQNRDTIIVDLRLQLHDHQKHGFGSKSKSSAQLALELILEELEIEHAAETDDEDASSDAMSTKPLRTPCKRKPFPNNLSGSKRPSPPVMRVKPAVAASQCWRRM